MKAKERVQVILSDRATPSCKDRTCDIEENPSHWVDFELTPLYAAAPELLKAAKIARTLIEQDYSGYDAMQEWQIINEAIAKAEGEKT